MPLAAESLDITVGRNGTLRAIHERSVHLQHGQSPDACFDPAFLPGLEAEERTRFRGHSGADDDVLWAREPKLRESILPECLPAGSISP